MEGDTSIRQSLVIQGRVIHALLMREIITRYGRHNIGFFWLFFEPAMFSVGITIIWVNIHKGISEGLSVQAFCFTGYSMILLWRNCGNRCCMAISPNLSLLFHRNVRVIDVLFARIILELAGCAMSFLLLMGIGVAAGFLQPPEDWLLMTGGYLMMAWFAASLSIWVCACTELSEVFDRIWHPLTYFMIPICGISYMVEWLPVRLQKLALCVPMVNGTEMVRGGYFGRHVHPHYSLFYMSAWCLGLMLVGLTFLKLFSRRVEPYQ